jgi:inositol oxygenase
MLFAGGVHDGSGTFALVLSTLPFSGWCGEMTTAGFRQYPREGPLYDFYRANHAQQTLDFVIAKKREHLRLDRRTMDIWEALALLNTLVDDSDPDTRLTQIEHLLQTAEAIRAAGHPRWFIVTGLIHDLGKILCLFGEPQWSVVGDTFPVGCAFDEAVVYPDLFAANPDRAVPQYQTPNGIYEPGCGLGRVHLSWGHDEYLYQVVKDHLPEEALYIIRYHSFYAWHSGGAYRHLMDARDHEMLPWVQAFQPFDLYSKGAKPPELERLRPFYRDLVHEFFPSDLRW